MKKNTQLILFLGILLVSTNFYAQTITDVFPTRVTTTSKVTIIGTDFTDTERDNIALSGIAITSRTRLSATEMTFEISETSGTNISGGALTIGAGATIPASETIDYIAPEVKVLGIATSFFIQEIYTNWDNYGEGFWSSEEYDYYDTDTYPNDKFELLGYKMSNGIIYSTGVDDDLLEDKLVARGILDDTEVSNGVNANATAYRKKVFKAYSTNGVQGNVGGANFILAPDLMDNGITGNAESGTDNNLSSLNEINNLTVFDVIIDGVNGLELGTGIANFNSNTDVRFYSGNGQPGAISDFDAPDLLISQVADAGGKDIYFYADNEGNVIGWPIKLTIAEHGSTLLARYRLDLYGFTSGQDFTSANPVKRSYTNPRDQQRPIRMLAFRLEDFGITSDPGIPETYIENIENINMTAGGKADIAFMAYNKAAFDIKVPIANPLLAKYVCKTDGSTSVTFTVNAGVEGEDGEIVTSPDPELVLRYEWLHYNVPLGITSNSLTINNIEEEDLGTYKVKIANNKGTIIMPVSLSQGGTPYIYGGSGWSSPYGAVEENERGLIFASDYNINEDLVGCDCVVGSGVNVTIPEGKNMRLYGSITVTPEIAEVTEVIDGETVVVVPYSPAGTFTLENNASLIQTKSVSSNENIGAINVKRIASDLQTYDYVYWSSPVFNYDIAGINGSANYTFEWDPNAVNAQGSTGDWLTYTGVMNPGQGYIKRVPSSTPLITTTFNGRPNNGPISISVFESPAPEPMYDADKNWNLVGNPYPSAINADKLFDENGHIGSVNFWTHSRSPSSGEDNPYYEDYPSNYGNQYVSYNRTGANDGVFSGDIASGQGFFVNVLPEATETSLNFTNAMRHKGALGSEEAYVNSGFYRTVEPQSTSHEVQKELVWLNLVNEAHTSAVMLVGYVEGATNEYDGQYDAYTKGDPMGIYSELEDSKMVIQGRSFPFEDTDTVPLGIDIPENGIYKIGIDKVQGALFLDDNQAIYLEDTYTNVIHDLRDSPYSFAGVVGSTIDRFILRYTSERLNVDVHEANDTFVYIKDQHLYLKSSENVKSITLYGLTGKLLNTYILDNNTRAFDAPFQYPRGVYLTTIQLDNNSAILTKKLIN